LVQILPTSTIDASPFSTFSKKRKQIEGNQFITNQINRGKVRKSFSTGGFSPVGACIVFGQGECMQVSKPAEEGPRQSEQKGKNL